MIFFPESFSKYPSNLSLDQFSNNKLSNEQQERKVEKCRRNGHTNLFYVYFLFSYYLGFVPFRFRYDCHQSTFTLHTWYYQKIFCATIHFIVLTRYALEIKKVHYNLKPNDPIGYFELIERSSSFLYKLVAFHHFWRKKDIFFRIIKLLEKSSFPQYNPYKMQSIVFLFSVCSFYIMISIIRLLFDPEILDSPNLASKSWYRGLVIESRYSYLLSNGESQQGSITLLDNFMAILTAINIQFRIMAGFYTDLAILVCVLSLWAPVVGYVNTLNESIETTKYAEFTTIKSAVERRNEFPIKMDEITVINQFKRLKFLSTLISEAIGGFLVPAISEIAFGYAIDFEEVILTTDPMRRFTNLLFYVSTTSTFIFAAETCRKISCVKTWLCVNENDLKISRNELMMILDNIAHDEICINAGGRITINYSFVGTMVVVLVTFFIIRLQSELPSQM